ncbi:MAG: hypothetical protein WA190_01785 [Usitatibacter sp.]
MRLIADATGVGFIGLVMLIWSFFVPAATLNGGMWLFFFALTIAFALYTWHKPENADFSPMQWARVAGTSLAVFGLVWLVGIIYALAHGAAGGPVELIESNGTFFVVTFIGTPLVLVMCAGYLRAVVLKKAQHDG